MKKMAATIPTTTLLVDRPKATQANQATNEPLVQEGCCGEYSPDCPFCWSS